jgi:hypothetical protein
MSLVFLGSFQNGSNLFFELFLIQFAVIVYVSVLFVRRKLIEGKQSWVLIVTIFLTKLLIQ